MVATKDDYSFGLVRTVGRKHPQVEFMHTRTTSMNAKFRNMIPATVDIYYEDGRGGSPQGTLGPGKEYTINTYETHQFFFTDKGNKKKELARFTMDKDQVRITVCI